MDSPSKAGENLRRIVVRPSMIDSLRGCGLSGMRIDKDKLRQKLLMPWYLRLTMRDSIRFKDPSAGESRLGNGTASEDGYGEEDKVSSESPMVVFINSKSGGRHGPMLKERLKQLMGKEQVFDLSDVKPHEFVRYGLGCLEVLARLGDSCAKECRERMRVMVAGGDGSVGWVLGWNT